MHLCDWVWAAEKRQHISSILQTHRQTLFHSWNSTSLPRFSQGPKIQLQCTPVRLYSEVNPVHSVICCLFIFCWLAFPHPPLPGESFIWPARARLQHSAALWLILIKRPPETGQGSSEYGQALSGTADVSLLTSAFPPLMLERESTRQGKKTTAA